ncbi:MAG: APC family permease [Deltaproteobacteria bacterium]|nr:APC family permease [Deltaproteobacteria bacterium]MDQ3299866.1 APC family permease [Myxococcota bacterium]
MATPSDPAATPDTPLARAIGSKMLIVFIVGDILGAGIYALVGKLSGLVGGMIWLPLAIGFAVAALTAGSYAELVGKYPRAAGAALYTHRAFNKPFLTFIVAFAVMMSGVASASAAALAFGGRYLTVFIPDAPTLIAAYGFIAAVTTVNFLGVSESVKVNLVLTIVEVTGLVIVIVVGLIGIARGEGDTSRAFTMTAPDGALLGVLGATALGFYALIGFEDSVNLAEECEEPARSFPRGLFTGIAVTGVIYVVVAFIAVTLVAPVVLATSSGPLLEVVSAAGVAFPPQLFAVIALLAIGNTALINMMMASRLLYGMANEGIVPSPLARVHAKRKTPVVAIGFTVVIALALITYGRYSPDAVRDLADTTVLLLLLVFCLVNVAVLVLKRRPVPHKHYNTPWYVAALGAVTTLVLASPLSGRPARVYLIAAALVGLGALLWGINRLITGRRITEIDAEKLSK